MIEAYGVLMIGLFVIAIIYAIVLFLLPFFVMQIKNEITKTNEHLNAIRLQLQKIAPNSPGGEIIKDEFIKSESEIKTITKNIYLKRYPDEGAQVVVRLYENSKIKVIDKNESGWVKVQILDTNMGVSQEGWLKENDINTQ